jgi:hypothetical protein
VDDEFEERKLDGFDDNFEVEAIGCVSSSGASSTPFLAFNSSESPRIMKFIASCSMAMAAAWAWASTLRRNTGSVL